MNGVDNVIEGFERCGLASLDEFADERYAELFAQLETVQNDFLSHEGAFRSADYIWERDTLHGWSRSWEYPYAFYHIRQWLRERRVGAAGAAGAEGAAADLPVMVDLGSGVTFFPFAVAREGCKVVCIDNDVVAQRDLTRAIAAVREAPGSVAFRLREGVRLPMDDGSAHGLFCVSVLEHIDDPLPTIEEAARILVPGGLFVLTIDIDLKGNTDIGPAKFRRLMQLLDSRFTRRRGERVIHPTRMLDSFGGPYPRKRMAQIPGLMWRTKEGRMLPVLGGPTIGETTHLACYGAVMTRR